MPSFIETEQQFYDYWVPFFFLMSFFVSLPKKLTALKYMIFVTALINIGLIIILIVDVKSTRDFNESKGATFPVFAFNF